VLDQGNTFFHAIFFRNVDACTATQLASQSVGAMRDGALLRRDETKAVAYLQLSMPPLRLIAHCTIGPASMSPAFFSPLVTPPGSADRAAAPGTADTSLSVRVLSHCSDFVTDSCSTPSPQGALHCSSSASAEMSASPSASCALKLGLNAAAPAFASPDAAATGAHRFPPAFSQLPPRRNSLQHGGAVARCCRRCLQALPPPHGREGCTRSGTAHIAAAALLLLTCVVSVAAADQALCASAWSTAALSVPRTALAATSLPNQGLAMFAGGYYGL
jgi:hypothetical protein